MGGKAAKAASPRTARRSIDWDALVGAALRVRDRAHAPYSGFRVGAALLGAGGRVYTGCNVENSSYGLSLCAERCAVACAVADGEQAFRALAIATQSEPPAPSCGACRQVLAEFAPKLPILLVNPAGVCVRTSLDRLLPMAFGLRDP